MMIGWATPTVAPLAGLIFGGPNGAVPVKGAGGGASPGGATTPGSPGAGSGSASAGLAPSTSTQPNTEAIPTAFRAPEILPLVQPDIYASLRSLLETRFLHLPVVGAVVLGGSDGILHDDRITAAEVVEEPF